MPRITAARRAANRTAIVDAARRRVARDGFHRTSMPEIAAEAGISTGALYRYFPGKEALIREIAGDALAVLGGAAAVLLDRDPPPSMGEIVAALVDVLGRDTVVAHGREIDADDQFRCAVQAWSEMLRDPELERVAVTVLGGFRATLVELLRRGRDAGRVPVGLDPTDGAQWVLAVLPGVIVQRTVLGLDPRGVARATDALL